MKHYTVIVRGIPHTMQLDEAEAKRLGATPVEPKSPTKASVPANKGRRALNNK